jgi:hypothetical protein
MRRRQRDDRRHFTGREDRYGPAASVVDFEFEPVSGDSQQASVVARVAKRPDFAKLAAVRGDL